MKSRSEFVEHVLELLGKSGRAQARAMFGGYGVYLDDLIIGIVADDVLYLKSDDATHAEFASRGLEPFTYQRKGGVATVMSFHRAPEEALETHAEMAKWARLAKQAALRAAAKRAAKPAKASSKAKAGDARRRSARKSS